MNATMAKKGKKVSRKQSRSGGLFYRVLLLVLSVPAIWILLPTIVFLFVTMLPTLVALIVDRSRQRWSWICVGGLNFAGSAPFLIEMWFGVSDIEAALSLLGDVWTILSAYLAAMLGWVLYSSVPPLVGAFVQMTAHRKIQMLRGEQQRLVRQWGEEVAAQDVVVDEIGGR